MRLKASIAHGRSRPGFTDPAYCDTELPTEGAFGQCQRRPESFTVRVAGGGHNTVQWRPDLLTQNNSTC